MRTPCARNDAPYGDRVKQRFLDVLVLFDRRL